MAGNGTAGFSGDNGVATAASLNYPVGVTVDSAGNLYIADYENHRIRKVTAGTGVITTVAGNGTAGFSGDNGSAILASLYHTTSVAIDSGGNLYIADTGNHRIRKVSAGTGVITTVAGNGNYSFSGDNGAANVASFNGPTGIAVDKTGNLYIADLGNNRIRKISAGTGIIATVAGNGVAGYSGDGGLATIASLNGPFGVAVDNIGNLYIADQGNNRIRKVLASTGVITTLAGSGVAGFSGDNGAATEASLAYPTGVAVDSTGSVYIADYGTNHVREVLGNIVPITALAVTITSQPMNYSNQSSGSIAFNANETATFECKMDSGNYVACTSPYGYSSLANGQHTFTVRATDGASNVSTPVSFTWTVNTALAASSAIMLQQTGQTTCYDASGSTIACTGTGQDGDTLTGLAWPNPRFTANSDQTVTDKLTGLIWSKDANPAAATKTWQQALDYIKTLNSGNYRGYNDWRMPNRIELESLVNYGVAIPASFLSENYFTSVLQSHYWSSTSFLLWPDISWIVNFSTGHSTSGYKTSYSNILPVRSIGNQALNALPATGENNCYDTNGLAIACPDTGQDGELKTGVAIPSPRFSDNSINNSSDLTIVDNLTGLIWSKNGNPYGTAMNWQQALDYIKSLNVKQYQGKADWRLPNINELKSLVNITDSSTVSLLNTNGFTNVQYGYWTSTTDTGRTNGAKVVGLNNGDTGNNDKNYSYYAWPVRGGQSGAFGSLTLSSATTAFAATTSGTQSAPTTLTLTNGGAAAVAVSATTITGTDATQFTVATGGATPCASLTPTLAAGASCTLNVTFAPTSAGAKSATLQITSNDATSPTIKSDLTGTAVVPVNGVCGTSDKQTLTAKPTGNLCSIGTATTVNGSGPWSWSCAGTNGGTTASCSATPDTTPPTVAITAPVNGASGNILWQIDGTASDNTSVYKVDVQIYNGIRYIAATGQFSTSAVWIPATTSNNWQNWTLDSSNFSMNSVDGSYTITVRATDGSNNISTPAVVSFTRGTATSGGGGTTTLLVSKSDAAAGTLSSNPAGINCDTTCGATGASYTTGAAVTLTATPTTGYYFLNWSNCDSPNVTTCTLTATSGHATVTANFSAKKSTTVTVTTPQTQKLTLNVPLTITGTLATLPAGASSDLNGQQISITVKPLTGTAIARTATTTDTSGTWQITLNDFTNEDTYLVEISYAGSGKLLGASLIQPLNVLVGKSAGYAIVIQGKTNDNNLLNEHRYSAEDIIAKLKSRSFLDEDSKALYSTATTAVTRQQIQDAITGWAKDKMNGSPAPLYIIMVDHGTVGNFHIGADTIAASDLKTWLETLETNLSTQAKTEKRIVIIGTCYSGSFIKDISAQGRIIITSAGEDEQSIGGDQRPWNNTIVYSGELFLEELFNALATGNTISNSFGNARDIIAEKDPRRLMKPVFHYGKRDSLMQHPLLDDNGDGNGEYYPVSDGNIVASITLGYGKVRTNGGDNPAYINTTASTTYLTTSETNGLLWLTANDNSAIDYAYATIRKPDSTTTSTNSGQVILNNERIDLTHNATSNRWEYTYTGFVQSGTYEIYYYTRDKATGFISPTVKKYLYKAKEANTAPTTFNLISPNNSQESAFVAVLWEESSDSDGLTYTLQVSKDQTFASIDYQKEGLTDTFTEIPNSALADNPNGTIWYWQVIAIDSYGAKQLSQKYSFSTTNLNGLPAIIKGYLYNAVGTPLAGAKVAIGTVSIPTQSNGAFMTTVPTGSYTVTVTATGYQQKSVMVTATAGKTVDASMSLSAIDTPIPVNGACGTDNTKTLSTTPANLCTTGTATAVIGAGPWSWTCTGTNGGTNASCSANIQTYTATGSVTGGNGTVTCTSTVNSGTTSTCTVTPASGYQLATFTDNSVDKKTSVTGGIYSITNVTANHTISATFSLIAVNGACGSSDKGTFTTAPTINFCSTGTATTITGTGPWNWTCTGTNGGATATCSASLTPAPVNGTCGSSDSGTFTTAPTTSFCTTGAPTAVTGTGPWSWTCDGANGGSTAKCTAAKSALTKPGDCDNSGTVTIAEVQSAINMFLGLKTVEACVDVDNSNGVSIAEVQKVINSFLGL